MRRAIAPWVSLKRLRSENDTIRQRMRGVGISERDQHIIARLAAGKSRKEMAQTFGVCEPRIMQIVAEAYQKMEKAKNG